MPPGTRWAAVVLTGPFTGVKEQVTGLYARRPTDAAFVTLVLDHRGFGAGGGLLQLRGNARRVRQAISDGGLPVRRP